MPVGNQRWFRIYAQVPKDERDLSTSVVKSYEARRVLLSVVFPELGRSSVVGPMLYRNRHVAEAVVLSMRRSAVSARFRNQGRRYRPKSVLVGLTLLLCLTRGLRRMCRGQLHRLVEGPVMASLPLVV